MVTDRTVTDRTVTDRTVTGRILVGDVDVIMQVDTFGRIVESVIMHGGLQLVSLKNEGYAQLLAQPIIVIPRSES
jgi:hypothetical protein